jgi:hypothetical protein
MPAFDVRAGPITGALALLLCLGQHSAGAQVADPEVFATSAGDVECTFTFSTEPELSCERFGPTHRRLVLGPTGYAQLFDIAPGEAHGFAKSVLEPGEVWSQGSFVCRQFPQGLTCQREGHGFHIGKSVVVAY